MQYDHSFLIRVKPNYLNEHIFISRSSINYSREDSPDQTLPYASVPSGCYFRNAISEAIMARGPLNPCVCWHTNRYTDRYKTSCIWTWNFLDCHHSCCLIIVFITVNSHGEHGVSNHWQFNYLFRPIITKMTKLSIAGLWWQNPLVTKKFMMTPLTGHAFPVTGRLCRQFTALQWIPRTKASDAELWYFLWSASE